MYYTTGLQHSMTFNDDFNYTRDGAHNNTKNSSLVSVIRISS